MRNFLRSSGRWLKTGWIWPLALLMLPNCFLDSTGLGVPQQFFPGPSPTNAIMCEIPKILDDGEITSCGGSGISRSRAAIALVERETGSAALDFSEDALTRCGGEPERTEFHGSFPEGLHLCINCGTQIPAVYPDPLAACIAKCKDLINFGGGPFPSGGINTFCESEVRLATNFDTNVCFDGACTDGGNPLSEPDFIDPRRTPEPVKWTDPSGADDDGGTNSLTRTAPTSTPPDFDAGAASGQVFTKGDGWVEFEASETDLSHVIGVRESCEDPFNCPDDNHTLTGIGFAISLNADGQVYVLEHDATTDLNIQGPFFTYTAGQRFRVKVTDNNKNDKTATITFSRLTCTPTCVEEEFAQQTLASPTYPLRVDAIFREADATLANVTIVRIK